MLTYLIKNYYQKTKFLKEFSTKSTLINNEEFFKWFSGFSDAEASFSIIPKLKSGNIISSFSFMFSIRLHIDDINVLNFIHKLLGIGNVRISGSKECVFSVTDKEGIKKIINIFDKFNLNTTKYLDYLDFKKAFNLYIERTSLSDVLIQNLVDLKNKMNTQRVDFTMLRDIKISKSWLLGFIEEDGSFNYWRNDSLAVFSIALSETQHYLLLKIKEFLIDNLGFDTYSKYKLNNSSIISINTQKARNNSKASTSLVIKDIHVLYNYLIPYLDELVFYFKKGLDFKDFKLICGAIYMGAHRNKMIKDLIIKLSKTMNNYRLSTYVGNVDNLIVEEWETLKNVSPLIEHLEDGRKRDLFTNKIIHQHTSSIYEIITSDNEIKLILTLTETAEVIGVTTTTLSKYLDDIKVVKIKGFFIRRVPIFYNK